MDIVAYNGGHDGQIVYLKDGKLAFSIESEKDSWPRYSSITPNHFFGVAKYVDKVPDVVAITGGYKRSSSIVVGGLLGGGYWGVGEEAKDIYKQDALGQSVQFFSSSHERSHIFCSYGLSHFPQGKPCYVLVWEGLIGAFYRVDENLNIEKIGSVLEAPGSRYELLYFLADPSKFELGHIEDSCAGKLMALVSYGKSGTPNEEDARIVDYLMNVPADKLAKNDPFLRETKYFNIGVEHPDFKQLARHFSDALYEKFFSYAREHLHEGLPLLISGGCGLNCDWNSAWKESGLFSDVFVPPCTNDSGIAIGTAIDAQHHFTGNAKVSWDVYAGEEFVMDDADLTGIETKALDIQEVADFLRDGNVIAWVQGRYEIGPRALGNRSLIAMPFTSEIHRRLNAIKAREGFRPIAPICLEEDISEYFNTREPSPHMLYFQKVSGDDLKAITHVDGSARIQTVNARQNPRMYELLFEFKRRTGVGVLCNTSLNFNGTGFINRLSDMVAYARVRELDGFVINDQFFKLKK